MKIEELFTIDNICNAFYKCAKVSYWKESTQRFKQNLLLEASELRKDILSKKYRVSNTIDFELCERGKIRQIKAPVIRDRVVQKVLMEHVLIPALTRPLIYDNYASLKKRGTSLARKRICVHLNRYIDKYGPEGYILQVDIKKYFDSIDHEILKQMYRKEVHESAEIMELIDYIIDTSSKSHKGLNLGSECPQIFAVYYLHCIDTYIKVVKSERFYGRYMDDMYIISNDKSCLKERLNELKTELAKIKLEVNENKTHITKLSHGFTFLQIKYNINGKRIIKRLTHDKIARERRRLKGFARLVVKGEMTKTKVYNCYKSWRESAVKDSNACWKSIQNIDTLVNDLFPNGAEKHKAERNDIVKSIFNETNIMTARDTERISPVIYEGGV